jgi:hypothetical protein
MNKNKTCSCGNCENQYNAEIEIDKKTWKKIEELRGDECREAFVDRLINEFIQKQNESTN